MLYRALVFHVGSHLGVVLGTAVATAVLVGALVVGDSLQGSLRERALARLGRVLAAHDGRDRFYVDDQGGAGRTLGRHEVNLGLEGLPEVWANVLRLPGLVVRQDGAARANRIQVLGMDEQYLKLGNDRGKILMQTNGVWLSAALARQLEVVEGDMVVVRLHKPSALSLDAVISPRDDASVAMRLRFERVMEDAELGGFDLGTGQGESLNAFVRIEELQAATGMVGRVNVLLAGLGERWRPSSTVPGEEGFAKWAAGRVRTNATLADMEMTVRLLDLDAEDTGGEPPPPAVELLTRRIFLEEPAVKAALGAGIAPVPALTLGTYLVNGLQGPGRLVPYSMVTAAGAPWTPADLGEDEMMVNEWLAKELGVEAGGTVTMTYYRADSGSRLEERTNVFRVRGVVPLRSWWADRTLMPNFPGLEKAESTHDWDAGFDLVHKISPADEAYWKEWKGTPKAFISAAAGKKLWANRFGELTSIRWYPEEGTIPGEMANRLTPRLRAAIDPASMGLQMRPVREEALASAKEGTGRIFGGLFVGFSLFIIVSALLLTALLFQFGLEQRAGEIGILLALGWTPGRVRWLHLREGMILAALGILPGALLGMGYARVILWGLNTAWTDAVAGAAVRYHATLTSVGAGVVTGLLVVLATLWIALRQIGRRPARELLNEGMGGREAELGTVEGWRRWLPWMLAIGAVSLALAAVSLPDHQKPGAFFGAGALALAAGVMGLRRRLLLPIRRATGLGRRGFAWKAPARQPRRSTATVALLASATFLIVAVAAMRLEARRDPARRGSGTGGFAFWGELALPLMQDLNTERGRENLGLSAAEMAGVTVMGARVRAGDDASCLNLNRAGRPRILGVDSAGLAERGSFTFGGVMKGLGVTNGWLGLKARLPDGAIPVIGDVASIQWALQKKVGDELELEDGSGRPMRVRIVGAVVNSVLQGNLLMDEAVFTERFPGEAGHRVLWVDAEAARAVEVERALMRALTDNGLEMTSMSERLDRFNAVQNTYLGTFQVLGGLGLLLGSAGLGIVVMRNVHERRGELGVLRALGFDGGLIRRLVLVEHALLVLLGLGLGCAAAALAVMPSVLGPGEGLPWRTLGVTLGAVLVNGLVWTWVATRLACRGKLLAALGGE
jgi:putative ABC transport system permease protein